MSTKVTEFGKFLRKLRIEHSTTLRKMAVMLDISSGYLSAIELGKRNIPEGLAEKVRDSYSLNHNQYIEMKNIIDQEKTEINVDLTNANDEQKQVFLAFARGFDNLDSDALEGLYEILQGRKGG